MPFFQLDLTRRGVQAASRKSLGAFILSSQDASPLDLLSGLQQSFAFPTAWTGVDSRGT